MADSGTQNDQLMNFIQEKFDELTKPTSSKHKKHVALRFKGNQMQHDFNDGILDDLYDLKDLVKLGSVKRSSNLLKDIIRQMEKRQKCIKIADRSEGGWDTVKEYLSDDLASNSEDERRLAKAEKRAVAKKAEKEKKVSKQPISPLPKRVLTDVNSSREKRSGRPDQPRISNNNDSKCFRCGRYGHFRANCYAKTRSSTSQQS